MDRLDRSLGPDRQSVERTRVARKKVAPKTAAQTKVGPKIPDRTEGNRQAVATIRSGKTQLMTNLNQTRTLDRAAANRLEVPLDDSEWSAVGPTDRQMITNPQHLDLEHRTTTALNQQEAFVSNHHQREEQTGTRQMDSTCRMHSTHWADSTRQTLSVSRSRTHRTSARPRRPSAGSSLPFRQRKRGREIS